MQNCNYQAKTEGLEVVESTQAHPRDAVFASARKCISEFNRRCFATFIDPITVEAIDSEGTMFEGLQTSETTVALCGSNARISDLESNLTAIILCASEAKGEHVDSDIKRTSRFSRKPRETNKGETVYRKAIIINLRLARHSPKGRFNTVEANIDGTWQTSCDWLNSFELRVIQRLVGFPGWRLQQQWWSKNGHTFRLMDLPAELRATILEAAIGPSLTPMPRGRMMISCGQASDNNVDSRILFRIPAINTLLTCRQI